MKLLKYLKELVFGKPSITYIGDIRYKGLNGNYTGRITDPNWNVIFFREYKHKRSAIRAIKHEAKKKGYTLVLQD